MLYRHYFSSCALECKLYYRYKRWRKSGGIQTGWTHFILLHLMANDVMGQKVKKVYHKEKHRKSESSEGEGWSGKYENRTISQHKYSWWIIWKRCKIPILWRRLTNETLLEKKFRTDEKWEIFATLQFRIFILFLCYIKSWRLDSNLRI